MNMPALAVLAGLLLIVGFAMSHSVVEIEGTGWVEPVLLWISICMPTGSGKSSLCKYLRRIVHDAQSACGLDGGISWLLDDQSFEKMGDMMDKNHWKLLGLYDELPMFLSLVNIFKGRGLSDSHELAIFLQMYGGDPWIRRTGNLKQSPSCTIANTYVLIPAFCTVSGDANFAMGHTGLTIGGFTQPSVARSLIEIPANVEKGLCQRFLWVVPKPPGVQFKLLEKVDQDFTVSIGKAC